MLIVVLVASQFVCRRGEQFLYNSASFKSRNKKSLTGQSIKLPGEKSETHGKLLSEKMAES